MSPLLLSSDHSARHSTIKAQSLRATEVLHANRKVACATGRVAIRALRVDVVLGRVPEVEGAITEVEMYGAVGDSSQRAGRLSVHDPKARPEDAITWGQAP